MAPAAAAAAAGARVLASYRAPLGCPTQQEYLGYVAGRSAALQLLPEAQVESAMLDAATRVRVRIQPDSASAGWIGALRIEGARALEREVRGERCQDVAQALALITVLRLDERAGEAPGALPSAVAERAGAVSDGVEPAPAAPDSTAASASVTTPTAAAVLAPEAVTASQDSARSSMKPLPAEPSDAAQAAAAGASAASAAAAASAAVSAAAAESKAAASAMAAETAPEALAAPLAAAEPAAATAARPLVAERAPVELPAQHQVDLGEHVAQPRGSELQPVLVAQAGYAAAPSHALQAQLLGELRLGSWVAGLGAGYSVASQANVDADLDFRLFTAQLSLCPIGGELSAFWWRACADLEGGALRVSVSARDPSLDPLSSTRPWFALGPSLQAGWPFAPRWALRAGAGGSLMLVRDRFEVERVEGGEGGEVQRERSTLYRPPPLSFELLLGVSYAF